MDIRETLNERGTIHGDYSDHARMSQMLKNIMASGKNWKDLEDHEKETLEMVAHKIGRILSGDPHYHDHWHDIAGYATLSADRSVAPAMPQIGEPPIFDPLFSVSPLSRAAKPEAQASVALALKA